MNVNSAITGEGDATENSFDFTVGSSFYKGNIVIGMQYTDRGKAKQSDRDFSSCPIAEGANGLNCNGGSQSVKVTFGKVGIYANDKGETVDADGKKITSSLAPSDYGLSGKDGLHPYSDLIFITLHLTAICIRQWSV